MPAGLPQAQPATYAQHAQRVADIQTYALTGRVAVLTEKKGFSGGMRWHHHLEGDDIGFYSPLGTQLGQISASADEVTLTTSDRKTYTAENAEALMQQTLGWSLPMAGLKDWVLGRPGEGESQILSWDAAGHIEHMRQNGWDIQYSQYREAGGRQLPGKVVVKSAGLDLKLVIDEWIGVQVAE